MNWYLAKIIYQIVTGDGNHLPQFDEQLRLLSAASFQEALRKAKTIGVNEQDSFLNENSIAVQWKFIEVSGIIPIHSMNDGAEVWSRITECDHADVFIDHVRMQANILEHTEGEYPVSAA